MSLPMYTQLDVENLKRRVARLHPPARLPQVCPECTETNHEHFSKVRVGPYLICRCMKCPTLVV